MAVDLQRMVEAAARAALDGSDSDQDKRQDRRHRGLSAPRALMLGAGVMVAGRLLASSRGRELAETLRDRIDELRDGAQEDEADDDYDEPEEDEYDEEEEPEDEYDEEEEPEGEYDEEEEPEGEYDEEEEEPEDEYDEEEEPEDEYDDEDEEPEEEDEEESPRRRSRSGSGARSNRRSG